MKSGLRPCLLTIAVVSRTALIPGASLLYPGILLALQRSPAALERAGVALHYTVVRGRGLEEIAFNLVARRRRHPAERLWGKRRGDLH